MQSYEGASVLVVLAYFYALAACRWFATPMSENPQYRGPIPMCRFFSVLTPLEGFLVFVWTGFSIIVDLASLTDVLV